ncbi:hypothetical protein [Achromobacter marplatensis]|uniref:Uncharacterized protein n=1 Tax=Achromobacter marplatensis TaxID=470868 RepID=A0AA43B3B4_9BURK|nr:hypothetical protein [Achromobacter marplatensis]MDH2052502.1 hypothetical protein [Achromobacter marplatensis]
MLDKDFKEGEAVLPVTGWAMMPVVEYDSLLVRLDFITQAAQSPDEASRGRVYALTSEQIQLLLESLQTQLQKLNAPLVAARPH